MDPPTEVLRDKNQFLQKLSQLQMENPLRFRKFEDKNVLQLVTTPIFMVASSVVDKNGFPELRYDPSNIHGHLDALMNELKEKIDADLDRIFATPVLETDDGHNLTLSDIFCVKNQSCIIDHDQDVADRCTLNLDGHRLVAPSINGYRFVFELDLTSFATSSPLICRDLIREFCEYESVVVPIENLFRNCVVTALLESRLLAQTNVQLAPETLLGVVPVRDIAHFFPYRSFADWRASIEEAVRREAPIRVVPTYAIRRTDPQRVELRHEVLIPEEF